MYKMRIIHIVTVIISFSVTISSEIEGGGRDRERQINIQTDTCVPNEKHKNIELRF